jgi:hypothetical protein
LVLSGSSITGVTGIVRHSTGVPYAKAGSPRWHDPSIDRVRARDAAALTVVLALAGVALQAKYTFETTRDSLRALTGPGPTRTQRELGAVIDGRLVQPMLELRRVIPREATFAVRVGLEPPVDSSLLEAIPPLLKYWLLPRRYTDDAHAADWVITFHHPSDTLGVTIRRDIALGPDVHAVEVA